MSETDSMWISFETMARILVFVLDLIHQYDAAHSASDARSNLQNRRV